MTVKTEKTYCDICGKEIEEYEAGGFLKWGFSVKDYMGSYCANGGQTLEDICDKCCAELNDTIIDKIEEIKARNKEN